MQLYENRDGVQVQAERVTGGEHDGLWHIVDANNVEGHVTDEQFQRNFTLVTKTSKGKS